MTRKMKDSGIEWIGQIPEDWKLNKIKFVSKLNGRIGFRGYKESDLVDEDEGAITLGPSNMENGKLILQNCKYLSWNKYYESPEIQVKVGDILLVKTASVGKVAYVSDLKKEMTINPQILIIKSKNIKTKFLFYVVLSNILQSQIKMSVTGGTVPTLSQEKIGNFVITEPPLNIQNKIVEKLDSVCLDIEKFSNVIKKEIQILEDYKKSAITEAVTKGLDKNVEMKDSGIEWIGEIPKHWEIDRVKYHFKIISGSGFPIEKQGKEAGDYPVCKASDIANANVILNSAANYLDKNQIVGYNIVPKNSIIMPKIGEAMKKNNRAIVECDVLIDNNCQGLFPIFVDFKFAYYLFKIIDMNWFDNSGTIPSINNTRLVNSSMPYPPKKEQEQIVAYLDKKSTTIDEAIAAKQKQLEILEEYKKSLIYEYVTGKKEVGDVGTI